MEHTLFPARTGAATALIPFFRAVTLFLCVFGLTTRPVTSDGQETGPVVDNEKTGPAAISTPPPVEEVQSASAVTADAKPAAESKPASGGQPSDEDILRKMPELSTDYLRNLLGIYARLGNDKMSAALGAELKRRDPSGKIDVSPESITREAMEEDASPPNPNDALEDKIDALNRAEKYNEAIAMMEKWRAGQFKGKTFPFEIELGDAYGSIGNFEAARTAYKRAAGQNGATAEQKRLAQAGLVEIDKLEGIKIAYDLIGKKKPEAALAKAEAMRKQYPKDVDVELLYAQALVPNYHYLEALPMLEALKAKHFSKEPYPAQDALAEALRATGRLEDAKAAYEELAKDATVPAHVRAEAELAARDVWKLRADTIQGSTEFISEGEGDAALSRLHASSLIAPGLHAGVDAWYYDVELTKERSIRRASGDFLGAVAFVRKYLDDNLSYLEVRAGGGEHGELSWGVSAGREKTHEGVLGYELSVDFNNPALDSLQMIALNGIEDKAAGTVTIPLPGQFEATAGAWARRVEADGVELGDGYGAFLEIGRPIWENLKETSRLYAAYRADYERFDAKAISPGQAAALGYFGDPADGRFLGAELVEPRYHPHGFQLTYESQINPQLFHFLSAGLYFDFADEEWDYNFSAGLEYAITDTIDLILEGGYYSDGTGAASNDDSAVFTGSIGVRAYY